MSNPDLVLRSHRVVTPGSVAPASVHIEHGVITRVAGYDDVPFGAPLFDAGTHVVMPGLVDSHVHINEPGRTEWEGFTTATRAAAAGGVTTLVDMPLNSIPPTTSVASLVRKMEAAEGKCWVDVGFWGGAVPSNASELRPMVSSGALGFKCFLVDSGVEEFGHVGEVELHAAMEELALARVPLLVHAELPGPIEAARAAIAALDPRAYMAYVRSRPREAEDLAVELLITLCRQTGAAVHVVHLSSSGSLDALSRARAEGLPISAETTPHYLHFAAEEIPDGATSFKCAPPIRERENREKLWSALGEGLIDLVVSDHSPCTPELKKLQKGDFLAAWGGIASLQFGLSVIWTEASRRGYSLVELARWMSENPAKLARLGHRKGTIARGYDADIVVWDPESVARIEPARIEHRHKVTPYAGEALRGVVEATYLRGKRVYTRERGFEASPEGQLLRRGSE